MNELSVDVLMMTYNHEAYIQEAIEGVLNQKTNFKVRLIIGNDCSTDKTIQVCQKYTKQYPNQIELVHQEFNIGHHKNFIEIYKRTNATYIALCEGDDYWTDPNKLQKQIDILEANPSYIICFHAIDELREDGSISRSNTNQTQITDVKDLIKGWYINTATYVFRNSRRIQFPEWFFEVKATDLCFHILIAEAGGEIYYIDEVMAVYRRHYGGVTDEKSDYIYHLRKNIDFYKALVDYIENQNHPHLAFANEQLMDTRERLFSQIRYKKDKTRQEFFELLNLAFWLKKFNIGKFIFR
jgi:glycosyltransferase involved in cell wall biosynthesis